jgi:hypothetical protein
MAAIMVAIGPAAMAALGNGWFQPSLVVPLFTKLHVNSPFTCNSPSSFNSNNLSSFSHRINPAALGLKLKIQMALSLEPELAHNDGQVDRSLKWHHIVKACPNQVQALDVLTLCTYKPN